MLESTKGGNWEGSQWRNLNQLVEPMYKSGKLQIYTVCTVNSVHFVPYQIAEAQRIVLVSQCFRARTTISQANAPRK